MHQTFELHACDANQCVFKRARISNILLVHKNHNHPLTVRMSWIEIWIAVSWSICKLRGRVHRGNVSRSIQVQLAPHVAERLRERAVLRRLAAGTPCPSGVSHRNCSNSWTMPGNCVNHFMKFLGSLRELLQWSAGTRTGLRISLSIVAMNDVCRSAPTIQKYDSEKGLRICELLFYRK